MRRISLLATALAVAALLLAATAAGVTVTRLRVLALPKSQDSTRRHYILRGPLVRPGDRDDVLGSFELRFGLPNGRHIRGVLSFPDGKLKFRGDQGHGGRFPIVGGTRRWNGASGTAKLRNLRGKQELITLTVAQG